MVTVFVEPLLVTVYTNIILGVLVIKLKNINIKQNIKNGKSVR